MKDTITSRSGLNPIDDIKTFLSFCSIYKKLSPSFILAYTIKPIIWGGLASRFARVPSFYAMVTGLGYAFQKVGGKELTQYSR